MAKRRRAIRAFAVLALLAAFGIGAWAWLAPINSNSDGRAGERPQLGLFTTLPIYWGEAADLSDLLDDSVQTHWARSLIERDYQLRPLDVLALPDQGAALDAVPLLLLAQPRALSAVENVALDDWVRGGGRVLMFADPMLTAHSTFAIGDARRPQDVVLLSPILARWGLELHFDDAQPGGEHQVMLLGADMPVDLPGQLSLIPVAPDARARCSVLGDGLAAQCRIGAGRALIVADAALLDADGMPHDLRETALSRLLAAAYAAD